MAANWRRLLQPGSYLSLTREWHDGDKIEVSLPMRLYSEPLAGRSDTARRVSTVRWCWRRISDSGPKDGLLRIGGYDSGPKQSDLGPPAEPPGAPAGDAADWIEVVSREKPHLQVGDKGLLG